MKRIYAGIAFVLAMVALALSGAAARAQEYPKTLTIGATAPGSPKFIWHQYLGWLEKELKPHGVKIVWAPFVDGGGALVSALGSSGIDIAYNVGSSPGLRIGAIDPNINLIAVDNFEPFGVSSVVVAANSPLKSVADLKDKKIAFLKGTVRHTTLAKILASANLTLDDVEGLHMPFETSGPALVRGDVDALIEGNTTVAPLLERGAARLLVDGDKHPEWASPTLILARTDYIARYPELIKTILKVDLRIAQWADANKKEALTSYSKLTGVKLESLRHRYVDPVLYQDPAVTDAAIDTLKGEEVFLRQAKLIKGTVDYDRWLDDTILRAVYEEAGRPYGRISQ